MCVRACVWVDVWVGVLVWWVDVWVSGWVWCMSLLIIHFIVFSHFIQSITHFYKVARNISGSVGGSMRG